MKTFEFTEKNSGVVILITSETDIDAWHILFNIIRREFNTSFRITNIEDE